MKWRNASDRFKRAIKLNLTIYRALRFPLIQCIQVYYSSAVQLRQK
jgi:hypothetical protein